jgi:hypothetical protein
MGTVSGPSPSLRRTARRKEGGVDQIFNLYHRTLFDRQTSGKRVTPSLSRLQSGRYREGAGGWVRYAAELIFPRVSETTCGQFAKQVRKGGDFKCTLKWIKNRTQIYRLTVFFGTPIGTKNKLAGITVLPSFSKFLSS